MKSLDGNREGWFVIAILLSVILSPHYCLAGVSIGEINGPFSCDSGWPPQGEGSPCWNPDGTMIAFRWGDGYTAWDPSLGGYPNPEGSYIVIMTADGQAIRGPDNPLVNDIGWDNGQPDWSPDGSWIVYIKSRVGPAQILKVPSTGGDAVPITQIDGNWHPCSPKWSPDGTKIAYRGGDWWNIPNPKPYHVWLTDTDGSTHEDLTPSITGYGVTGLSWSPDGTEIVFTQQGESGLFVLNLSTLDIDEVTPLAFDLLPGSAVWVEENLILFDAGGCIYDYQIDTQTTTQLTYGPGDSLGDWHPTEGLVFSSTRGCTVRWDSNIYTANPLLEPGLLAYWKFDEGSEFIAGDSSGNGKDGIIDGATWTTGKIGDALSFDGFDDWVDIPDDISPEHITLEAWIYPTGFDDGPGDQGNAIIQRSTGGAGAPGDRSWSWRLRIMPRNHLAQFQAAGPNTGVASVVAPTALVQNRWYHLAATYDGNVMKIYVDGELKATDSNLDGPLETYHLIPVAIGCLEGWGLQHFQGIIDEVRVYGRALTSGEIAEHAIPVAGYAKPGPQTGNSSDIVLIYIGQSGTDLRDWNQGDFTPYISYVNEYNTYADKWMFDSFLFLARRSHRDRVFESAIPPNLPSKKKDWDWLLERLFGSGKQIDALHAEASRLNRKLNVFVMIPYPDPHAKQDFGDVDNDGIKEDFTNNDDRYKAVVWYIEDKFLTEWNARNYDNFLKLVGFYWMNEGVSHSDDELLLKDISDYIHSKNYKFIWIPSYANRNEAKAWNSYGFDFALVQPNYYQTGSFENLTETADLARDNCLGVVIEFNEHVDDPDLQERFRDYLYVGKIKGYREQSVLAYYQGVKTVLSLSSPLYVPQARNLYDDLYKFINRSGQLRPDGDADVDGIPDYLESATGTDPFDDDTDNDGLLDGPGSGEDVNANGVVDGDETDPRSADTDGDGIQDGTECGLVAPDGLDTDLTVFVPDADPNSTTDPTNPDTDGDGLLDGEEDLNGNGAVDPGETDPTVMEPEPMVCFELRKVKLDFKAKSDHDDDFNDKFKIEGEFLLPTEYTFSDLTKEVEVVLEVGSATATDKVQTTLKARTEWSYKKKKSTPADGVNMDIEKVEIKWSKDMDRKAHTFKIDGNLANGLFDDGSGVATVTVLLPMMAGCDLSGTDTVTAKVRKHHWDFKSKSNEDRCIVPGDDDD